MSMKDTDKYDETAREIIEELTIPCASDRYDRAFQAGYDSIMNMPVSQPKTRTPKMIATVAASCAAMLVLSMFILNTANPALAESLPIIGGVFKTLNKPANEGEVPHTNLVIEDLESVAETPKSTEITSVYLKDGAQTGVTFYVEEFYYDGYYLHIGTELVFDEMAETLNTGFVQGYISFDGETWFDFYGADEPSIMELNPTFHQLREGRFLHTYSFPLPEEYQQQKQLTVQMQIQGVEWWDSYTDETISIENPESEEISFTAVSGITEDTVEIDTPVTVNGITLSYARRIFPGEEFTLESLPWSDDVHPIIQVFLPNGEMPNGATSYSDSENGIEKLLMTTQEDVLIVLVRNKQSEDLDVLAEFTVNFADQAITETQNYLDPDNPIYNNEKAKSYMYGYFPNHDGNVDQTFYISTISGSTEKPGYIAIGTTEERQDLRVEVYRNDQLLGSCISSDDEFYRSGQLMFDNSKMGEDSTYSFITVFDNIEYMLSEGDQVTVKIYDGETDEKLYEETVTLDDRVYF